MKDPETDEEWQVAANAANELLFIHASQEWGLIAGGPEVDVQRCEEILRLAEERGIVPDED